jgi:protoporphyrinogen oxidase
MLLAKYGEGICERFLFPYNEKLYACDLDTLDVEAMGRFFPHANPTEIIQNFRRADNASYNSTFFYPPLGIGSLVDAFNKSLNIHLNEEVRRIDLDNKVVETTRGEYQYQRLISTIPLNKLLKLVGNADSFLTYNRVLVFNFGLDASSPIDANWVYIPDKGTVFYRVGFYDRTPHHRTRMYVEIGLTAEGAIDVEALRSRTVEQLKRHGFITDQKIVAEHHVVMDPAYCHITRESEQKVKSLEESLKKQDVYLLGRYAKWIYCSIEDNILAARELAADLH